MYNTDYPYHYSRMPEKESDRNILYEELRAQFEQDICSNPLYDEFFADYEDRVRPNAARHLAVTKINTLKLGKFLEQDKNVMHHYLVRHLAEKVYRTLILQKKLFNLQCLWRAGRIHIPQIYCTMHFQYWQEHILRCPFIEPPTDNDVEILKRFLAQNEVFLTDSIIDHRWQLNLGHNFRDSEGEIEGYPEFYAFYDREAGTEYLTKYEDVVGKAERRYLKAAWNHRSKQMKANNPPPPVAQQPDDDLAAAPPPPAGVLGYVPRNLFDDFVARCEHKYIAYLHKRSCRKRDADRKLRDKYDDDEEFTLSLAVRYLKYIAKPVYTTGRMLWYKDIIRCAAIVQHEEIIAVLDKVHHDETITRPANSRTFIINPDYSDCKYSNHITEWVDTILEGRELLGEPRNFDYLSRIIIPPQ